MLLSAIHVDIVELPLRVPFATALRKTSSVTDIRVTLTTADGAFGVGSAAPTPAITGDTTAGIAAAIRDHIHPALRGVDLSDLNEACAVVQRALVRNTSAKAAVDIALHDLHARLYGVHITRLLGGAIRELATDATVSLGAPEGMAAQATEFAQAGFRVLKVKLGGRDGRDVERVSRVRDAVGPGVHLRVDANQAWTARQSLQIIEQLPALAVEYVEQPVPACDLEGLREVSRQSALPIAADESVFEMSDLLRVLDLRAANIINIKLMKSGGLRQAAQMAATARAAGAAVMIGSMMEGAASVTAAASLAAATRCDYIDLDAAYFLADAAARGGLSYDGPAITLTPGDGLAVEFTAPRLTV